MMDEAQYSEDALVAKNTAEIERTHDGSTDLQTLSADSENKIKKVIRRKRKPARPQIDATEIDSEPPPQTGIVYNIWYNKWSGGDREDKYLSQTHAKGRCQVTLDSGYTRADKINGSYFCIQFARGVCPRGQDCEYLHRLPGIYDHFSPNIDCFGRNKHSDYRDDMGGFGSFMRQNRTLYVGRIVVADDIEETVARHFQEWGEIERIRVLTGRGVAFITYINEANAQFAKEAMAHQSLDKEEILNVRWATADPNPLAQKREARKVEEQAAEAVRRALPASFVAELEGRDPDSIKRRKRDGNLGLAGYEAPDSVWYSQIKNVEGSEESEVVEQLPSSAKGADRKSAADSSPPRDGVSGGGLLGNATAEAFKRFAVAGNGPPQIRTRVVPGLLVGYGSDDDSE